MECLSTGILWPSSSQRLLEYENLRVQKQHVHIHSTEPKWAELCVAPKIIILSWHYTEHQRLSTHEDYQNSNGQLASSCSSVKEHERSRAETCPHSRANEHNELQTGSPFSFHRVLCLLSQDPMLITSARDSQHYSCRSHIETLALKITSGWINGILCLE